MGGPGRANKADCLPVSICVPLDVMGAAINRSSSER